MGPLARANSRFLALILILCLANPAFAEQFSTDSKHCGGLLSNVGQSLKKTILFVPRVAYRQVHPLPPALRPSSTIEELMNVSRDPAVRAKEFLKGMTVKLEAPFDDLIEPINEIIGKSRLAMIYFSDPYLRTFDSKKSLKELMAFIVTDTYEKGIISDNPLVRSAGERMLRFTGRKSKAVGLYLANALLFSALVFNIFGGITNTMVSPPVSQIVMKVGPPAFKFWDYVLEALGIQASAEVISECEAALKDLREANSALTDEQAAEQLQKFKDRWSLIWKSFNMRLEGKHQSAVYEQRGALLHLDVFMGNASNAYNLIKMTEPALMQAEVRLNDKRSDISAEERKALEETIKSYHQTIEFNKQRLATEMAMADSLRMYFSHVTETSGVYSKASVAFGYPEMVQIVGKERVMKIYHEIFSEMLEAVKTRSEKNNQIVVQKE